MTTAKCDFCQELRGSSQNSFHRIYGSSPVSRLLLWTSRFAVLPSLGQIAEGYLLVVSREHFRAIGDLSASMLNEFHEVFTRVGEIVHGEYGRYVAFEHGTRSEGMGGCGIYHAHLHMVPIGEIPDPVAMLKAEFPFQEFGLISELGQRSRDLPSYLFYRDPGGRLYLFDTGPLPSQYMRRLLGDALHVENWDWRVVGREERLLATVERLSPKLAAVQRTIESHANA